MEDHLKKGKLVIAGAGPGDPELLTIKAMQRLGQADVVLTDRLVSHEILNSYVNKNAIIIYVGKQCRRGFSTPQQSINNLIVHHCLLGKNVVRLKGGDVSLFSNILDELETAVTNKISYEIIPGVTAAAGAAAYAGIPLTARGYATAVRFLTFYKSDVVTNIYWKELACTNDTLAFYMSSETLDDVVENLIAHNIDEDKLLAITEQATTPFQQIYTCSLYDYKKKFRNKKFISPSLVIIGKVVSLHQQFAWRPNAGNSEIYFRPMNKLTNFFNQKNYENVS